MRKEVSGQASRADLRVDHKLVRRASHKVVRRAPAPRVVTARSTRVAHTVRRGSLGSLGSRGSLGSLGSTASTAALVTRTRTRVCHNRRMGISRMSRALSL